MQQNILNSAPGGAIATAHLIEAIRQTSTILSAAPSAAIQPLRARLSRQLLWFAHHHPGRVHALRTSPRPFNLLRIECVAFGIGGFELTMRPAELLASGFQLNPQLRDELQNAERSA